MPCWLPEGSGSHSVTLAHPPSKTTRRGFESIVTYLKGCQSRPSSILGIYLWFWIKKWQIKRTLGITSRTFIPLCSFDKGPERGRNLHGICMLSNSQTHSPRGTSLLPWPWDFKLVSSDSFYFQLLLPPFPFILMPLFFPFSLLFRLSHNVWQLDFTLFLLYTDGEQKLSTEPCLF